MNNELVMKRSSFKEGLSVVSNSTKKIKKEPMFFLKIIFEITIFMFLFNLILSIIPKNNDIILFLSQFTYNFITFLLIPSYIIQRLKNELDLKFQIQTAFNSIFTLRILFCVLITIACLFVAIFISSIPFLSVVNHYGIETFSNHIDFIMNNLYDSEALYNNREAYEIIQAISNIDQIKIFSFMLIGAIFFIFSMVIMFYTFFVSLYFEYIKFSEALKFGLKLNFRNAGFFMASTLGILLVVLVASVLSSIIYISLLIEMITLVYVYYIFSEITKKIIK